MNSMLRLPPLPSIGDILKLYRLHAKKQLAQNFLLDERLTNKIVKQVNYIENGTVIEVGPGPGGLTRSIMKRSPKNIVTIEKDKRFKPTLEMLSEIFSNNTCKMDIIFDDILKTNMSSHLRELNKKSWDDKPPNINIIGNLPFNVSTPLIIKWLQKISIQSDVWSMGRVRMCLTFQKEVAERLVARESDDQRCRLSVMAQTYTNPRLRFIISGKSFIPPPDVDVGVVTFEPLIEPKTKHDFFLFEKITRHIFSFRQKYSLTCVKTLFPPEYHDLAVVMFKLADVHPTTRPYQLTIEEINRLCSAYKYLTQKNPEIKNYNYRSSRRVLPKNYTTHMEVEELANKVEM